ncbi:uncharacterized protein TRIVIDRAFT_160299 [Trichoderma virens Gv29-8]|uniref:Uncharacterized protein n=1 Tax=Hypocrea virens (strain Gv29-8 / FGSC 10586) TaxID=413071 RepID=G9N6M2_HYPVG|nr:uncharacterized protein TRIVIDRAFT_160299 [Trichoderma virens Gv29-8]EHK17782.1 hypothetical protein TRIVIDRAFT_160299 [Trichoderma virens Gv29-8]
MASKGPQPICQLVRLNNPPSQETERKQYKIGKKKTYNSRCSLMVTHSTTNLPVRGLSMGEQTGPRILLYLWSYVLVLPSHEVICDIKTLCFCDINTTTVWKLAKKKLSLFGCDLFKGSVWIGEKFTSISWSANVKV